MGVALTLGACGKDPVEEPGLQPGAQGEVELTATEPVRLKLSVKAGQLYRFVCEVVAPPGVTLSGCVVQLRDAKTLEPLGEARSTGIKEKRWQVTAFWTASTNGLAVMDLQSPSPGDTGQFRYLFTEAADDAGGSAGEAVNQPVTETGSGFEGSLESAMDVDAWRLSVPAGHILQVKCSATEASSEPNTELIRPDGTSLGTYNFGTYPFGEGIPYLPVKNVGGGDLILLVRPAEPRTYSTRYTCWVNDAGPDDHGDVAAQATVVTVPAQVDVTFGSRNDVDVLGAELVAGHVYLLKDSTYATPSTTSTVYCGTTVTDPQGMQQGSKLATYGEGARFTATTSGRYFFALERSFSNGPNGWIYPKTHHYEITDVTP
ncbi:hypothetical protein D7Y13_16415 [Corallococcus praedator]|uniref:Lipoprotein n=1 Tax=Corallococcus praedator TaxID=2316724 RepID=A0ABX9QHG2_9BACT|nr:hypothetical protein D7X75_09010 [Corallococcus sp. CA031C]RKI08182.1 hypothetical protein D7Y13_16415 [Corallococcus praedator]